jgi:pimeloyl-ACP methyl ester carboxylesterase
MAAVPAEPIDVLLSYAGSVARDTVKAHDGIALSSFRFGHAHADPLVFIMPAGLEARIVAPLANALAKRYRVITWETRLSPGLDGADTETACDMGSHVRDVKAAFDHHGIQGPAPVFSWCSSTQIALQFAREFPDLVASLVLISPYLRGVVADSQRRERNRKLYARVVKKPDMASTLVETTRSIATNADAMKAQYQAHHIEVAEMVARPLMQARTLLRYSRVMNGLDLAEPFDLGTQLSKPILVVSGLKDQLADPAIARSIVEQQHGARLLTDPDCDHYIPVTPGVVLPGIEYFLRDTISSRPTVASDVARQ